MGLRAFHSVAVWPRSAEYTSKKCTPAPVSRPAHRTLSRSQRLPASLAEMTELVGELTSMVFVKAGGVKHPASLGTIERREHFMELALKVIPTYGVAKMVESTKGRVFFTAGRELDRYVVWDYIKRRKQIIS